MFGCAVPRRTGTSPDEVVEILVGEPGHLRVEQRKVDVLAAARAVAFVQRRESAVTAYMPHIRSETATPTFCGPAPGSPSGTPVMLIRPPIAWIIAS